MVRSTRRNNRSRKITRSRKNLSMTRPKRRGKKITFKRRASKKDRTRRFKKKGGGGFYSSPEFLKRELYFYDKIIMDTFNDEGLSKEEKIAKLKVIESEIIFYKKYFMRDVTDSNKLAVNRIFDNYIGEHGSINDAIMGLEMEEARAEREPRRDLGDLRPVKRSPGLQPKYGSINELR